MQYILDVKIMNKVNYKQYILPS